MSDQQQSMEEFEKILCKLTPHDFDGHTEFANLSAEQKLMWLSQIQQFYWEFHGLASNDQPETSFKQNSKHPL